MPFLLLLIVFFGLTFGASYYGTGEDPKDARTLTVDQFYYNESSVPQHGFVNLTEGQLYLPSAQLFTGGNDSNEVLYIPVLPWGSHGEKVKLMMISRNKDDIALCREMFTQKNDEKGEAWMEKNWNRLLRALPTVSGKLAEPPTELADLAKDSDNNFFVGMATLDTQATSTAMFTFVIESILLGGGIIASLLYLGFVVVPSTSLAGPGWRKDRRGIIGAGALSDEELVESLNSGTARLAIYPYAFSLGIVTLQQSSDLHYRTSYGVGLVQSLPYMFTTLYCGWWGIPWGPIYTVSCIGMCLRGGADVTDDYLQQALLQGRERRSSDHFS